jgi:hypothetical protein
MVYPHTSKSSELKHVQLFKYAKLHDIRLECFLYLGATIIQSHAPINRAQKSTNRLAKDAFANILPTKKKPAKEVRFFKLSCDGMYQDGLFGLFVCIAPTPSNHKEHRLMILCQDIMNQNKFNSYRKFRKKKRNSNY